MDQRSPHWFGANKIGIRSAESTALIAALLFVLQATDTRHHSIFTDALTVLQVANGTWSSYQDDLLMQNLRATYLAAWTLRKDEGFVTKHVKSHSGVVGNEFADYLAVQVRLGHLQPRPLPKSYARWFATDPPGIHWAWQRFDEFIRPYVMPNLVADQMICTGPDIYRPRAWLRGIHNIDDKAKDGCWLSLKCVQYNVCTLRKPGAASYLRQQLEFHQVHVAALQETRTPEAEITDSNYIRIISPASSGQGGCELWFSRNQSIGKAQGHGLHFQRSQLLVLHADAELLVVAADVHGHNLLVVSAHAPHKSYSEAQIKQWWQETQNIIHQHSKGRTVLCFIDANARIGEMEPWAGSLDEDSTDTAGQCLLCLCQAINAKVLNTFPDIHYGSSATWQGWEHQLKDTRNDYIIASSSPMCHCVGTWTDHCLDAGHSKLDHIPLFGQFALCMEKLPTIPKKTKYDRTRLASATPTEWKIFFDEWPRVPWNTPVTEHAQIIEEHLHLRLAHCFPQTPKHRKDSCFSDTTWQIHEAKLKLKKVLSQQKKCWDRLCLTIAFKALCDTTGLCPLTCLTGRMVALALRSAARLLKYKSIGAQLQQAIKNDRQQQIQDMASQLAGCNAKEITKHMQPLRMGKRLQGLGRHHLPMVNLANGQLATTHQEGRQRWRHHFAQMEAGIPTDPMELAKKAYAGDAWDDLGWEDIPTIYELETQLRKTKARKATGLDLLPGEIFKFAPSHSAYHLYPLLQKMAAWSAEPVQYKGGRLAIAHKKGCPREVDHYRALLISSTLGKALHNVWRQRSLPFMRQAADPLQISAQPGALVAQAAHLVRLHLGAAKTRGVSCYTLFLDIRSAYYKIVRQFAFDLDNSDLGVLTLLHRLGIEQHIDDVATALKEQSTLRQLQCPEPLHRMVTTFHEQTWFQIQNDEAVIETQRGTRPGDGYADLVWNLVYSKFIHRLSARLQATGAYEPYTWNTKVGLDAAEGDREEFGFTTTWADDTAVMGWHVDATSITPMLRVTTEIVYEELLRLGMQPNTKPGKTEAIVDIRGAHSLTCRQYLHGPCKSTIALDIDDPDMNTLRVVPTYVHLGGVLVQQNKHLAEIKRRIAMTHKSIAAHRSKVYGNATIDLEHRVALFKASAFLTLTYNIGTWSKLNDAEHRAWRTGVMSIYRKLLSKLMPTAQQHRLTDRQLLAMTNLPGPDTLLHVGRLRHYGLCLHRPLPLYWRS